jgi:hypothetical protein
MLCLVRVCYRGTILIDTVPPASAASLTKDRWAVRLEGSRLLVSWLPVIRKMVRDVVRKDPTRHDPTEECMDRPNPTHPDLTGAENMVESGVISTHLHVC